MRSWSTPHLPLLSVTGPAVSVFDSALGSLVETQPDGPARLYVCGITPYDATHIGHAATYVSFDLLNRAWRNAGYEVTYVQNVTDVDDPLLERAAKVQVDWVELAERQTQLFRDDMAALRVLPPAHYLGAVESVGLVIALIEQLQNAGAVYSVDNDLYFSVNADKAFGAVSGLDRELMLTLFAERGGDPDRLGKKDQLDCLLWRAERPGEPSWESPFGAGRPGWHIECSAIALHYLGVGFDVQGGGTDLIFPHHEMCASEAQVACPGATYARAYTHQGMVAYDGAKMSKSRGNLVFVSELRHAEVDPMAIRLALSRHHYRDDWEWTNDQLWEAVDTLESWRTALSRGAGAPTAGVIDGVLGALAQDLDSPSALDLVEKWAAATNDGDDSDPQAGATMQGLLDAALGLAL
jgi:L-cysteine:1D-myo-inositol 2-amino-2-deoxy-alpha-D-glucopyranoside ligase